MIARVAAYYAPEREDPLHHAGSLWLGRDAETNAPLPQPEGLAACTADARRYGLHATFKAPFRLGDGASYAEACRIAASLAAAHPPFPLPRLAVVALGRFLALGAVEPCQRLHALADACVRAFDPLRALPNQAELARRRASRLTPEQETMLQRWGYPHVLGTWHFHLTLSGALADSERPFLLQRAEAHFAEALLVSRQVASLCLFTQPRSDAPFVIAERFPLGGS